jgi:acetyl-CoA carboxylase biotin carboxyl carrier protein
MTDTKITSDVTGLVWKVLVAEGDQISEESPLVVLESMKMEIPILSTEEGVVVAVLVKEGDRVNEGDAVVVLKT